MFNLILNFFIKKKKNLGLEVFLFMLIVFVCILTFQIQKSKYAIYEVCELLKKNYLEQLSDKEFNECMNLNSKFNLSSEQKIKNFNSWLRRFHISHLYIYNSKENKKMWMGESVETGIIAKHLFGKWKVIQILTKNSPLQVGDEILSINGKKIKSAHQISSTEGDFEILRGQTVHKFKIIHSDIVYDERIITKQIQDEWAYLKIPSFKSEKFGYDELALLYQQLNQKKMVIDLRDNLGGNFVAMLRVASMLLCEDKSVGAIFHNRTEFKGKEVLKDDLSDQQQILQVSDNNPVYLKLFKTELCLNPKKITVIINEQTASVSELFVQILKTEYKNLKIVGTTSAGQMVLSIWYTLKHLGPGVMISIPYAWATANDKEVLEGQGVQPSFSLDAQKLQKHHQSLDPLLEFVWEMEGVDHSLTQDDISKAPASASTHNEIHPESISPKSSSKTVQ